MRFQGIEAMANEAAGNLSNLVDRLKAAEIMGVSPGTIDNLRKHDGLPSIKLRGRRLFDPEALREFAKSRTTTG